MLIGLVYVKFPGFIWYLEYGWVFDNAEPSELILIVHRVLGYFGIISGICYFLSFFVEDKTGPAFETIIINLF